MDYSLVKVFHIISVICWMAGLFYLPRLFVYHAGVRAQTESSELFKIMERRLYRGIMNPAMVATWVFGIWMLVLIPSYLTDLWFMVKAAMVAILTIQHHVMGWWLRGFAQDRNTHTARYYRFMNEVPTVALVVIIFMVIMKP